MPESRHVSARSEFGARLKQSRESRGLSLRDIAATTKISVPALEALEHGDPRSCLAASSRARSSGRSRRKSAWTPRPPSRVRRAVPVGRQPNRLGAASIAVDDSRERRSGPFAFGSLLLAAAAVTAFALMGWVPFGWLHLGRAAQPEVVEMPAPPPAPAAAVPAAPTPGSMPPATSDVAATGQPVAADEHAPLVHDIAPSRRARSSVWSCSRPTAAGCTSSRTGRWSSLAR